MMNCADAIARTTVKSNHAEQCPHAALNLSMRLADCTHTQLGVVSPKRRSLVCDSGAQ
jgi:hypothetical protein